MEAAVLIVGAGPSGLTAANILARQGVQPLVLDSADGPTDQSRALIVQARTMELWDKLGLSGHAARHGREITQALGFLNGRALHSGGPLFDIADVAVKATPFPYLLVFEQSKTEKLLLDSFEAVGDGRVHYGHRVTQVTQDAQGVVARCEDATGAHDHRADWLIGTDGASSVVRHGIGASFDGGTYEQRFFLADVALEWGISEDDLVLAQTQTGTFLFVPMPSVVGEPVRYRVLGSLPDRLAEKEHLELSDVQAEVDAHSGLTARLSDPRWLSTYKLHHRMADRFREGRMFLAGDAAHIHSPVGGQGMNTGIQDAYNLAWKLGMVARGTATEQLLDSYDAERQPVARALLHGTDTAFSTLVSERPWTRREVDIAAHLAPHLMEIDRLRGKMFSILSQLAINYRDSPAVGGETSGHLRPGDRLPHVVFDDGAGLHGQMQGVAHYLLTLTQAGAAGSSMSHPLPEGTRELVLPLQPLGEEFGVKKETRILVRPDGYIEWIGSSDGDERFVEHLRRLYRW